MTFDELASGHTAADVIYRVLMLWKRRLSHNGAAGSGSRRAFTKTGNTLVDVLVAAVDAAGNTVIADVIVECYRVNLELTNDCFSAAAYVPLNTPQPFSNGHGEDPHNSD